MDMIEAIKELSESELIDLAVEIYRMGYLDVIGVEASLKATPEQLRARLRCRIEEWLEI